MPINPVNTQLGATLGTQNSSLPNLQEQLYNAAYPRSSVPAGWQQASQQAQMGLLQNYIGDQSQGGFGGYEPIAQAARQRFQEEELPNLLQGFQVGSGQYNLAKERAMQNLERNLRGEASQYRLQNLNQLQSLLGGQQQFGLQQQQYGLQGLTGLNQQYNQNILQLLSLLLGGQKAQAGIGLGQGGDTQIDPGALGNIIQLALGATKVGLGAGG